MKLPFQADILRPQRRAAASLALTAAALAAWIGPAPTPARAQADPVDALDEPMSVVLQVARAAETALRDNELQIAESHYRSALLEGWLMLGSLAIEDGELARAKRELERAAAVSVESRRPLTSLALVRLELGEVDEALEMLRAIVLQNPVDTDARRLLSRALVASDRVEEAIQELEQLRAVAPDNLENAFLLATAHLRQGEPDAAEPLFAELTEARPIAPTWVLIGRMQRDYGNYDRARLALERALEIDPRVRRANYYLGSIALLDQGRGLLDEALRRFEAELEVSPDDPTSNLYLGIGLVESRRYEDALKPLEAADRLGASPRDTLQFLGRAYLALDRPAEAATALAKALELAQAAAAETGETTELNESQIGSMHYQLALALRRSGDEESAAPHFEASRRSSARVAESSRAFLEGYLANETRETTATAGASLLGGSRLAALEPAAREELRQRLARLMAQSYLNLGVLQMRKQHHARAAELLAEAAELAPDFPNVQYSLGVARFNAGLFASALDPLERAREQSEPDLELRRMLALARLNTGQAEPAAELLANDPGRETDGSLQYAYGLALVRSGRGPEAEEVFAKLLVDNADWPGLNVVLGQAHAQQDDFDTAIGFLQRATALDPAVAGAHATLGDIYLRQGKLDEAETALRSELASHPEDTRANYTLAVVLDLNRKTDEALTTVQAVLERDPLMADARYLLGKILLARGDAEAALEQLSSAAGLSPRDPNIRYQLGLALQKLGRTGEAGAEFELFRQLKDDERSGGAP